MSPIPLVTTPSAQSTSGAHITEANPEPAAVQASGQHPTSKAPLGGDTSVALPSDAAREAAASVTDLSARNGSPARTGSTVGKTVPCTACMCAKEVAGYSEKCRSHCCSGSMICTTIV